MRLSPSLTAASLALVLLFVTACGDSVSGTPVQVVTTRISEYHALQAKYPGIVNLPELVKANGWKYSDNINEAEIRTDSGLIVYFKYGSGSSGFLPESSKVNGFGLTVTGDNDVAGIKAAVRALEAGTGMTLTEEYFDKIGKKGLNYGTPLRQYPEGLVKFANNGDSGPIWISIHERQ